MEIMLVSCGYLVVLVIYGYAYFRSMKREQNMRFVADFWIYALHSLLIHQSFPEYLEKWHRREFTYFPRVLKLRIFGSDASQLDYAAMLFMVQAAADRNEENADEVREPYTDMLKKNRDIMVEYRRRNFRLVKRGELEKEDE